MDSEAKQAQTQSQALDIVQLAAWVHANKQRLIMIAVAVVAVGAAIGIYIWYGNHKETSASEALSVVRPSSKLTPNQLAEGYLKVANEHPGTLAGGHALLLAAAATFDAGNYKDAEGQFQRFLADYSDSPLAGQAQLGIAASLEAEGKTADAATKYREFRERHPQDAAVPQATSALARLLVGQGKFDQALKLYQDLASKGNNDSWTAEAGIQAQELINEHPELKPKPAPAPAPTQTLTPSTPNPMTLQVGSNKPAAAPAPAPTKGATITIPPPTAGKTGAAPPLTITNKP